MCPRLLREAVLDFTEVENGMMLGHWYLNQPGLKTWALGRITDLALYAVIASGVIQVISLLPSLRAAGFRFRAIFHVLTPQVRKMLLMTIPVALSAPSETRLVTLRIVIESSTTITREPLPAVAPAGSPNNLSRELIELLVPTKPIKLPADAIIIPYNAADPAGPTLSRGSSSSLRSP